MPLSSKIQASGDWLLSKTVKYLGFPHSLLPNATSCEDNRGTIGSIAFPPSSQHKHFWARYPRRFRALSKQSMVPPIALIQVQSISWKWTWESRGNRVDAWPRGSPGQTESPKDMGLFHCQLSHSLNPHCSLWVTHYQAPGYLILRGTGTLWGSNHYPPILREVKTETWRYLVTHGY